MVIAMLLTIISATLSAVMQHRQMIVCPFNNSNGTWMMYNCICYQLDDETVNMDCSYYHGEFNRYNDSVISDILDSYLSMETQGKALPLKIVNLAYNALTKVPSQIPLFPRLSQVQLSTCNSLGGYAIEKITSGAFNFTAPLDVLNLGLKSMYPYFCTGSLATIEPDAFQGISLVLYSSVM